LARPADTSICWGAPAGLEAECSSVAKTSPCFRTMDGQLGHMRAAPIPANSERTLAGGVVKTPLPIFAIPTASAVRHCGPDASLSLPPLVRSLSARDRSRPAQCHRPPHRTKPSLFARRRKARFTRIFREYSRGSRFHGDKLPVGTGSDGPRPAAGRLQEGGFDGQDASRPSVDRRARRAPILFVIRADALRRSPRTLIAAAPPNPPKLTLDPADLLVDLYN
jgi:hypothetical protein